MLFLYLLLYDRTKINLDMSGAWHYLTPKLFFWSFEEPCISSKDQTTVGKFDPDLQNVIGLDRDLDQSHFEDLRQRCGPEQTVVWCGLLVAPWSSGGRCNAKKAVTAHFSSKQLLLFGFAWQCRAPAGLHVLYASTAPRTKAVTAYL